MKPSTPAPYPSKTKPRDVPARVDYLSGDVVTVTHPAGTTHKRCLEAIDRLRARGLSVLLPPSRESLAAALIELTEE